MEWCHDGFWVDLGSRAVTDPYETGTGVELDRVERSGSWTNFAWRTRAAYRRGLGPYNRGYNYGPRPVRSLP